jgi:hypothetical protein
MLQLISPIHQNPYTLIDKPLEFSKETPRTFQIHILAPKTSFFHIFSTVTVNQVILLPEFSESHPLFVQAIHMLMIAVFV